jgi:RNA polymerase sigma factor (sigma-70 family)
MSEDLTEQLKRDPESSELWAKWHKGTYPKVFALAHSLVRSDTDAARDIAQEAFARFVQFSSLDKVTNDGSAIAYLQTICRNIVIDRMADEKRSYRDHTVEVDEFPEHDLNPDQAIDLDRIAKGLDGGDRELFDLAREGMSIAEIAGKLSITYTAAGVRLHRLLGRLRKTFA